MTTTSTTTTPPTTKSTTTTTTTTTTTRFPNCPFRLQDSGQVDHTRQLLPKQRSVYCPESYCPAVYISSTGGAAEHQAESLGCFDYEGSLMGNEYPDYMNNQDI